jgi:8-oxo-dGTP diphosphatase
MRKAAVMLIVKDGLILAVSRRYNSAKFGLLGGKLEKDELPAEAAIRETYEESGVKVISCEYLYTREEASEIPGGESFFTDTFYATKWEGEPFSSEEGIVKWISAAELTSPDAAFPEYNRNMLNRFKEKFPNIKLIGENV